VSTARPAILAAPACRRRKLVEAGVTCVEVDLGGWDNHQNIFPTLSRNLLPQLDKGMGTLVKGSRGPRPVGQHGGGMDGRVRAHAANQPETPAAITWARCWSVVLGGGGLKGGIAHGATSKDGSDVASDACSVGDLFATLYKAVGIDPDTRIRDLGGRPHKIAGDDGKPIAALLKKGATAEA